MRVSPASDAALQLILLKIQHSLHRNILIDVRSLNK